VESGVDDCTLWETLKDAYRHDNRYAKPLFERKFHKALWKTPYDFAAGTLSATVRNRLLDQSKVQGPEPGNISDLEKRLCAECNADEGEVMVATRVVKHFDPTANRQVYFWIGNSAKEYGEVCGASPFAGGPTDYPILFYDSEAVNRDDLMAAIREVV
jgi:hypothetical protein